MIDFRPRTYLSWARFVESEGVPGLQGLRTQIVGLTCLYGPPRAGGCRITFDAGDYVLKVPYNDKGMFSNELEGYWEDESIPLAACELVPSPIDEDFTKLLKMEKVTVLNYVGPPVELPDWVREVDACQVGYNSAGELVAFDL